jgi:hypothetical protein
MADKAVRLGNLRTLETKMNTNVSDKLLEANRLKATNKPREAFVDAWSVWTRDTAKALVAASPAPDGRGDFEEMTALLKELGVCHDVMAVLVGEIEEGDDANG